MHAPTSSLPASPLRRMFRRAVVVFGITGAVLLVALILAAANAERILFWYIRPSTPFHSDRAPAPPNYEDETSWATVPTKPTEANVVPDGVGLGDAQKSAADVFFVHGTSFLSSEGWNSPMASDSAEAEQIRSIMAWQASAFNGCCRIYAPRYRDATLEAFFDQGDNGKKALDLAYGDVARAFDHFIAHTAADRPFLIAGHSQGSLHILRLLEEKIDGTPLFDRLVVAYAIGIPLPRDKFVRSYRRIMPCSSATDTHCLVSWNTYRENGSPEQTLQTVRIPYGDTWEHASGKDILCINPLTWRDDESDGGADRHLGAIETDYPGALKALFTGKAVGARFTSVGAPIPRRTGAQCRKGFLWVPDLGKRYVTVFGGGYHNYDYTLFYMNLRQNASDRLKTLLQSL